MNAADMLILSHRIQLHHQYNNTALAVPLAHPLSLSSCLCLPRTRSLFIVTPRLLLFFDVAVVMLLPIITNHKAGNYTCVRVCVCAASRRRRRSSSSSSNAWQTDAPKSHLKVAEQKLLERQLKNCTCPQCVATPPYPHPPYTIFFFTMCVCVCVCAAYNCHCSQFIRRASQTCFLVYKSNNLKAI